MHDNGLLKYYSKFADEYGRLKTYEVKDLKLLKNSDNNINTFAKKDGNISKQFFEKKCNPIKSEGYSEIMQSQIFKANGLNSAIYLPSTDKIGSFSVISDDILLDNSKKMYEYIVSALLNRDYLCNPYDKVCDYKPSEINFEKIFTHNGMKEFILAHALDVAGGNLDRHTGNFGVDVVKDKDGLELVDSLRFYDHALTFLDYPKERENLFHFENGLGFGPSKTRGEMIAILRNCPHVSSYYSPNELAEIVGNVDIRGIAKDIKEQTNFIIDNNYLNRAEESYFNTAQDLVKGVAEDSLIQDLMNNVQ